MRLKQFTGKTVEEMTGGAVGAGSGMGTSSNKTQSIADPAPVNQPEPIIAKAKELEMDNEFPDEDGNVVKVVSPVGQGQNKNAVVVQNQKSKEYYTLDPEDDVALPQVQESDVKSIATRGGAFQSKISKLTSRRNKLKQMIRAATYERNGGAPLFEINFNNKDVISNALDAPISCGFEAETVWPDIEGEIDLDNATWGDVEAYIEMQYGWQEISKLEQAHKDWIMESDQFFELEHQVIMSMVHDQKEDEDKLNQYVNDMVDEDAVEEYKEEVIADIENQAKNLSDPEARQAAQEEYKERQGWDDDAWAREYVEEEDEAGYEEWLADEIRDDAAHWDQTWEIALEEIPIEKWMEMEYGSWYDLLADHDLYLGAGSEEGLDEIATRLQDWALNEGNSISGDVQPGGYHSGKSVDNDYWRVEEDSSIEGSGTGAEIISPVYATPRDMLREMNALFQWFESEGVVTNQSTGLHITMSYTGREESGMNKLKLAVLLGDRYVLKQFGRSNSTYTQSQQAAIQQAASKMDGTPASIQQLEDALRSKLRTEKFSSINFKGDNNSSGNELVEFRIAGGDNYHTMFEDVAKATVRYAATLEAAHTGTHEQDYAKALMRIASHDGTDIPQNSNTGNIPSDRIISKILPEVIGKRDDRLDIADDLGRAYWYLQGGDQDRAQQAFINFMWALLKPANKNPTVNIQVARAFKEMLKDFQIPPQELIHELQHLVARYGSWYRGEWSQETVSNAMPARVMRLIGKKISDDDINSSASGVISIVPDGQVLMLPQGMVDGGYDFDPSAIRVMDATDYKIALNALRVITGPTNAEFRNRGREYSRTLNQIYQKYNLEMKAEPNDLRPDKYIHVALDDPDLQTKLRNAGVTLVNKQTGKPIIESTSFSKLPLMDQLETVRYMSKDKIDEAWQKMKTPEQALPVHNVPDDLRDLMSKPLLASDIKRQMEAYFVIPDPSMLRDFRLMRSTAGDNADLREILSMYAEQQLHPRQLKKAKATVNEGAITRADLLKADQPYLHTLLKKIQNGDPIGVSGGAPVVIDKREAKRLANILFPGGDPNNVQIDDSGVRPKYVPADPQQFRGAFRVKTNQGDINLYALDKDSLKGDKVTYNKGDVGEIMMGAAVTDYFRTRGNPSVEGIKHLLSHGNLEKADKIWTMMHAETIRHGTRGKHDNLEFRLAIRKGSLEPTIEWAQGKRDDLAMDNLANSAVNFANRVNGTVQKALETIAADPNKNTVSVLTDGVSDQTGTKADLIMSIDGQVINLLSLKVGSVKQFGQVSGYTYDVIEDFVYTTFGVQLPPKAKKLDWSTPRASLESFKSIQGNIFNGLKKELSGGPQNDIGVITRIFKGIQYHATRNDDGVEMVILGTSGVGNVDVLRFDDKLFNNMAQVDFDVEHGGSSESSLTIKIVAVGGELAEEFAQKYRGQPVLLQIRMGVINEAGGDYMRNRVEMGSFLKYLAKVEDNEDQ